MRFTSGRWKHKHYSQWWNYSIHYQWSDGAAAANLTRLTPGTYLVTVTDANNCTADTSFTLTYTFDFTVQASPGTSIKLGDSASLIYTLTGNAGTFENVWNPSTTLSCATCVNTAAFPVYTTLYQILVTDSAGCTASDTVTINVIPQYQVFIPNAFTPNGTGNNDFFEIFGKKETWKFVRIQLYDRIGERVFDSTDPDFKWDGSFKGKGLPPGVYVYELRIVFTDNHTDQLFKGCVTLLR